MFLEVTLKRVNLFLIHIIEPPVSIAETKRKVSKLPSRILSEFDLPQTIVLENAMLLPLCSQLSLKFLMIESPDVGENLFVFFI